MNYFLCAFFASLKGRFRSRSSWVFFLLALVLTLAVLLIPGGERQSAIQVGLVLPEKGGEALEALLQERSSQLVCFVTTDEETLDRKILSGEWDCGLVLAEDFECRVASLDTDKVITWKTGPASTVYPLVQETVASCMMELLTPRIAREYMEQNGIPTDNLEAHLDALQGQTQRVSVTLQTLEGEDMSPLELTDAGIRNILRGLICVFTLVWGLYLTVDLGSWLEGDAAIRLRTVRSVTELLLPQLTAALLSVFCWGLAVLAALGVFWESLGAYAAFVTVVMSIGLILPRFRILWQAVLAVMPFLVAGSLLLEPVLLDISTLFPTLSRWTGWLPVTLFVRACEGNFVPLLCLLAEAAALTGASILLDRVKRKKI